MSKHIVILGAGYAGLLTAITARKYLIEEDAKITIVNQYDTHQTITELHRLAAGNVSERNVAIPLSKLLKGKDVDLKVAKVESFSADMKRVDLSDGSTLIYDYLVVALGSVTAYFGIPGLEENSMVLKSVEDAMHVNAHIQERIRQYSISKDPADATIVIGGGGLTGVELAGEIIDEMPKYTKKYGINPREIKVKLIEAGPKILPVLPDVLIERATKSLEKRGVEFLTSLPVTSVAGNVINLKDGQKIISNTFVWTGGVQGSPLVGQSDIEVNRGRATVNEYLQSTSHNDVFVVGDSAVCFAADGRPYAPTAQNAWQMGELTGYNLFALIEGKELESFNPINSGTLASLGRKDAVATIGGNNTELKGLPATLMKEASNIRYLSHIKALSSIVY